MTARCRIVACAALAAAACASPGAPRDDRLPERVVVYAPSAAETLAALDLTDRVVAVGSHGPWPEALASLESAGSFDRPDLERVLALECDLVLTTASVAAGDGYERLKQLGVRVELLDTSTFDGVFTSLERIGEIFGREERAALLAGSMRAGLEAIDATAAELPRRKVLVVVGRDPLYVAGPGSHLDELVRLAGGENLASDAAAPYQQYSIEAVLERGPEVIIDTSGGPEYWSRWPFLPAVENGSVYRVDPAVLAIPGVRLPEMARAMAQRIHPEAFPGRPVEAE